MDFLKKAVDSAKKAGSSSNNNQQQQQQQQQGGDNQNQNQQGGEQKQDYGDKAFGFLSKKAGLKLSSDQQEKVTDGARGAYEKFSGKKVDPKYSN
ncbi:hypothetical protein VFPPC_07957 [Pochonia chlamydosporia 170]|uniref:Uncharacterized protein n=1 Tax=Pochonia chlamydosporia 170 TaxID=1380566 RepID=A0A179FL82_METCM|nr:hypothetical protein VFPPC_07957 [Pochonia chlamydosporia 170]OAQ66395.1 hypothetical protein VFPPC_07957 [Pochonia chlamydosporia 170]